MVMYISIIRRVCLDVCVCVCEREKGRGDNIFCTKLGITLKFWWQILKSGGFSHFSEGPFIWSNRHTSPPGIYWYDLVLYLFFIHISFYNEECSFRWTRLLLLSRWTHLLLLSRWNPSASSVSSKDNKVQDAKQYLTKVCSFNTHARYLLLHLLILTVSSHQRKENVGFSTSFQGNSI